MSHYPLTNALAAHPDWPICEASYRHTLPGVRGTVMWRCGYPLDPANGDLRVHPSCEAVAEQVPVTLRRQRHAEQIAVRRAERLRLMSLERGNADRE